MTVLELSQRDGMRPILLPRGGREITGGYAGDLLSWVMGRAAADAAWVTIMSNRNLAAVAQLTDVACVVLAEGVEPDAELLTAAGTQEINLLGSSADMFSICAMIAETL